MTKLGSLTDEEKEQVFLYLLFHISFTRVIQLIGENLNPEDLDQLIEMLDSYTELL